MASVREATSTDAPGIARVHVESWRTTYRGLMPDAVLDGLSVERRVEQWQRVLCEDVGSTAVFVAVDDAAQVIGFASCSVCDTGIPGYEAELHTIYLLDSAQGGGLGRRLMAAARNHLVQAGASSMLLWVLKDNQQARRFYEALGGRELRTQPFEIGGATLDEVAYGWRDLLGTPN